MSETVNPEENKASAEQKDTAGNAPLSGIKSESSQHKASEPTENRRASHPPEKRKSSGIARAFQEPFVTNWTMVIFTGIIAACSFLGYCNVVSTSKQTGDLVNYAKRQAAAADKISGAASDFKTSAAGIEQHTSGAVTELSAANTQARATTYLTQGMGVRILSGTGQSERPATPQLRYTVAVWDSKGKKEEPPTSHD